jgi:hypothetical protein
MTMNLVWNTLNSGDKVRALTWLREGFLYLANDASGSGNEPLATLLRLYAGEVGRMNTAANGGDVLGYAQAYRTRYEALDALHAIYAAPTWGANMPMLDAEWLAMDHEPPSALGRPGEWGTVRDQVNALYPTNDSFRAAVNNWATWWINLPVIHSDYDTQRASSLLSQVKARLARYRAAHPQLVLPPVLTPVGTADSDFWSGQALSAKWMVQLRDGSEKHCATQVGTFFRALKAAIGRPRPATSAVVSWTAADTASLRSRASGLGLRDYPVSIGQTVWTPEMLKFALWLTYHRTEDRDSVLLPIGRTTFPRSNVNAPDDHEATVIVPLCTTTAWPDIVSDIVLPSQPGRQPYNDASFTRSDFWSGTPWSARWSVQHPDGSIFQCATQARTLLRAVKFAVGIQGFVPTNDPGTWTAEWTARLREFSVLAGIGNIGFSATQTVWTPEMLRIAIWTAYARDVIPSMIGFPADTRLPLSGVAPPDDGIGTGLPAPSCLRQTQVLPTPVTPRTTVTARASVTSGIPTPVFVVGVAALGYGLYRLVRWM